MKGVERYCEFVRKKTERVLKRMFGCKSIKEAFMEKSRLALMLEWELKKAPVDFTEEDIRFNPYGYARWRTLDKILSIYLDSVALGKFIVKEL